MSYWLINMRIILQRASVWWWNNDGDDNDTDDDKNIYAQSPPIGGHAVAILVGHRTCDLHVAG